MRSISATAQTVEALAKHMYDNFEDPEEYLVIVGHPKPSWDDYEEFNKDDLRTYAKLALDWVEAQQNANPG